MKHQRPTKAIIAAAGFGTRFLPQTKAMPKEMLPLVDKPIIQYVVEELVEAGIRDIIIVTGYSKRSIEDHFDTPNAELAALLLDGGKKDKLEELQRIANMANFVYVRQKELAGSNAAPVLCARHLIQDEPFVYVWADELIKAEHSRVAQAVDVFERTGATILPCFRMGDDADYDRYGVVGGNAEGDLLRVTTIKEKPGKTDAPSDFASISGYVLTPEFLRYLDRIAKEHTGEGELRIQTAMQMMMDEGHTFYGFEVQGKYYDAGDKLEYVKTVVDFALEREDIGGKFREFLEARIARKD